MRFAVARNNMLFRDTGFGALALHERGVARHVPFLRHVHDQVVVTKDGVLAVVLKVDGFCFQTADQSEINMLLESRNTAMMALKDSRFAVYSTLIRKRVDVRLNRRFDNAFCAELDARYEDAVAAKNMFANDLFITIMFRGFQGDVGRADRAMRGLSRLFGLRDAAQSRQDDLDELLDVARQMAAALRSHGVRLLSVVERPDGLYSEICEFLVQLLNGGQARPMRLPRMGLDEYLPTQQILFGRNAIEFRGDGDPRFGAMVSLHEFPPVTAPGMLDRLLELPHEFIVSQSFQMVDRPEALDRMNKIGRQVASSDARGTELEEDLNRGRSDVMGGVSAYGLHHLSVLCVSDNLKGLNRVVADVNGRLSDMGMIGVRESLAAEAAFWAQLPSNFGYIARSGMISSRNFAGFASLHNYPLGKKRGNHWGEAICCLETTSQTPYFMNFHVRDVGHFAVFGPTGSGKTVLLNFLVAQTMAVRYGPARQAPRVVFFDKDRGAEIALRALGGRYLTFEPGEASGLDPLMMEDTAGNRAALVRLVSFMVRPRDGSSLGPGDELAIVQSVAEIMKLAKDERSWLHFVTLFAGRRAHVEDGIAERLSGWLDKSDKGWLFNNGSDEIDWSAGVVGFDMTNVLDDADVRTAAMMYIFHRMDELLTGAPLLVVLDEGWKLLDDPVFESFIRDKLKTYRKLNAAMGFATQSVADVVGSRIKATVREQVLTTIYYPNPRGDSASYQDEFKLSNAEFDWVTHTDPQRREFILKHDHDAVVARLDLGAAPELVAVLSGRPETIEEVRILRAERGDDPAGWLPEFLQRRRVAREV